MTIKDLDKVIKETHDKLIDGEASNDKQPKDPELDSRMQVGKLTHDYEWNLRIVNNEVSNPTPEEIEQAKRDIEWYEDYYLATGISNAAKQGYSAEYVKQSA